jgi:hypothetical protein
MLDQFQHYWRLNRRPRQKKTHQAVDERVEGDVVTLIHKADCRLKSDGAAQRISAALPGYSCIDHGELLSTKQVASNKR